MTEGRDLEMLEDPDYQEPMGQAEAESTPEASEDAEPTCVFSADDDGRPMVICPDVEAQQEVVQALEENPEVVI